LRYGIIFLKKGDIEYNGLRFCKDEKTGYYLNSTIRKRLHRYVWEQEVGEIPKGCHIHHIDGDKSNNSINNLTIITASGHARLHGAEAERKKIMKANIDKARVYAIEWHKSEEGRKWHSEQSTGHKMKRYAKKCEVCGKEYQGTKIQRFCSGACKAKFRRDSGADDIKRICPICGKEFMTERFKPNTYCSKICAGVAHIGWYDRKQS